MRGIREIQCEELSMCVWDGHNIVHGEVRWTLQPFSIGTGWRIRLRRRQFHFRRLVAEPIRKWFCQFTAQFYEHVHGIRECVGIDREHAWCTDSLELSRTARTCVRVFLGPCRRNL